jgi:hypothetical protein
VAALPAGGVLVVWTSVPVQGVFGVDVLGRFFDDLGSPTGPEFQVNVYPNEESYGLDLAVAGDGSFVVVWSGRSPYGQFFDVFAQRFDHQGAPLGVGP